MRGMMLTDVHPKNKCEAPRVAEAPRVWHLREHVELTEPLPSVEEAELWWSL